MNILALDPSKPAELDTQVAVVGSGPAGAAAALAVAQAGMRVLILEEGPLFPPAALGRDGFRALATLYRALGGSLTSGPAPVPFLQGRAVGGTSVMNGAISWRLPRHVHDEWVADDPALESALPFERIEAATDEVERRLNVRPTDPAVSGRNNELLRRGAERLGLEHRPIFRNVLGCEGRGQCLEGCPAGRKLAMDRSYLPAASALGAQLLPDTQVIAVQHDGRRAHGLVARSRHGHPVRVKAEVVMLAASAIQTPLLLLQSGLGRAPTGWAFQAHPGVSVSGVFAEPVRVWTGATQGHEVIGLVAEGLKIEALGFDRTVAALRLPGVGPAFGRELDRLDHYAYFGAAIRAEARGRVRLGFRGRPRVDYRLTAGDAVKMRRGVAVLGRLLLAAGAEHVLPGVHGFDGVVSDPERLDQLEAEGPLSARAYQSVITHMFGTARMGSDRSRSVVRPDFRHHDVDRLYVADSSVFPSNTGVNPQTSILALATLCGRHVAEAWA